MQSPPCTASSLHATSICSHPYAKLSSYCVHTLTCYTQHPLCAGIYIYKRTPIESRYTHSGALLVAGHSKTAISRASHIGLAGPGLVYKSLSVCPRCNNQDRTGVSVTVHSGCWTHVLALQGPAVLELGGRKECSLYFYQWPAFTRGSALHGTASNFEGYF